MTERFGEISDPKKWEAIGYQEGAAGRPRRDMRLVQTMPENCKPAYAAGWKRGRDAVTKMVRGDP